MAQQPQDCVIFGAVELPMENGFDALADAASAFREREFRASWPYLWLDAIYLKSREAALVTSRAVVMVVGVSDQGRRKVLATRAGRGWSHAASIFFTQPLFARTACKSNPLRETVFP